MQLLTNDQILLLSSVDQTLYNETLKKYNSVKSSSSKKIELYNSIQSKQRQLSSLVEQLQKAEQDLQDAQKGGATQENIEYLQQQVQNLNSSKSSAQKSLQSTQEQAKELSNSFPAESLSSLEAQLSSLVDKAKASKSTTVEKTTVGEAKATEENIAGESNSEEESPTEVEGTSSDSDSNGDPEFPVFSFVTETDSAGSDYLPKAGILPNPKFRVFVMGVEISDWISGVQWGNDAGPEQLAQNATITLLTPHDIFSLTEQNIFDGWWKLPEGDSFRTSEAAKKKLYDYKQSMNFWERSTLLARWNLTVNSMIFHSGDTIRVFAQLPWTHRDAWLPVFTGYLDDPSIVRNTTGEDVITLPASTIAAKLAKARVMTSRFSPATMEGMDKNSSQRLPTKHVDFNNQTGKTSAIGGSDILDASSIYQDVEAANFFGNMLYDVTLSGVLRFIFYGDVTVSKTAVLNQADPVKYAAWQKAIQNYQLQYQKVQDLETKLTTRVSNDLDRNLIQKSLTTEKSNLEEAKKAVFAANYQYTERSEIFNPPEGYILNTALSNEPNTTELKRKRGWGFLDPRLFLVRNFPETAQGPELDSDGYQKQKTSEESKESLAEEVIIREYRDATLDYHKQQEEYDKMVQKVKSGSSQEGLDLATKLQSKKKDAALTRSNTATEKYQALILGAKTRLKNAHDPNSPTTTKSTIVGTEAEMKQNAKAQDLVAAQTKVQKIVALQKKYGIDPSTNEVKAVAAETPKTSAEESVEQQVARHEETIKSRGAQLKQLATDLTNLAIRNGGSKRNTSENSSYNESVVKAFWAELDTPEAIKADEESITQRERNMLYYQIAVKRSDYRRLAKMVKKSEEVLATLKKQNPEGAKATPSDKTVQDTITKVQNKRAPVNGKMILNDKYHVAPTSYRGHQHDGIDLKANNIDLVAPCDCYVFQWKVDSKGLGNVKNSAGQILRIVGCGDGVVHEFFHLKAGSITSMAQQALETGSKVSMGTKLATTGNTGSSTGPHLHWGTWIPLKTKVAGKVTSAMLDDSNRKYIDPQVWLGTSTAAEMLSNEVVTAEAGSDEALIQQAALNASIDWVLEEKAMADWHDCCLVGFANGKPDDSFDSSDTVDLADYDAEACYSAAQKRSLDRVYLTFDEVSFIGKNSGWMGIYSPHGKTVAVALRQPASGWGFVKSEAFKIQDTSFDVGYTTRLQLLSNLLQKLDYYWYITGNGDVVVDFPHYELFPDHYSKRWRDFFKLSGLSNADTFQENFRNLKAAYMFRGGLPGTQISAQNYDANLSDVLSVVYQLPCVLARDGLDVEVITWPYITDKERLKILGGIYLRKQIANCYTYNLAQLPPMLFVIPNTPLRLSDLDAYGLVKSTNFIYSISGGTVNFKMTLNLTALRLRLTEEQMYIRQQLGKFLADSNTATAKSTEELEALMIKDRQAFRNTLKQKRRDELASGYAYGKVTPVR